MTIIIVIIRKINYQKTFRRPRKLNYRRIYAGIAALPFIPATYTSRRRVREQFSYPSPAEFCGSIVYDR